jgi:hypothetical protein
MRTSLVACFAAAAGITSTSPAAGVTFDYSTVFAVKNRSVYAPGPSVGANSGTRRIGPGPQDLGKSYGKVYDPCRDTPLPSCDTGAEAGADAHFNFGLNYGAKFNSGSFDAQYPLRVRINAPTDFSTIPGQAFTLRSDYTVPGYTSLALGLGVGIPPVKAQLQAHSPTLEAFVDLDATFNAFVGARACVVGICQGPSLGRFDTNQSQTLAAFNRNGDGLIKLGGETAMLNKYFTFLDGNLTARLNVPTINGISSPGGGSTATQLVTNGRSNIVSLGANVSNLISNGIGIPLTGNIGGIGYNLLDVSAGVGLDIRQTLSLTLQPMQTYNFLSPVRKVLADGSFGAFTKSLTIPMGEDLTLVAGVRNLGVVPVTSLVARLSNITEVLVAGDVAIQALRASIFGFDIGPLYDSGSVNGGIFSIPIFQNNFDVDFGSITGNPFNIRQSLDPTVMADPGSRAILNLLGEDPANPGVFNTEIRGFDLGCGFLLACPSTFFADGSPITLDDFGQLAFLFAGDSRALPGIVSDHVGTDDEQLAALYATGFSPNRTPIVAPPGLPRPAGSFVPEPGSWAMMIAGFGLVGAAQRRRTRSRGVGNCKAA